MAKQYVSDPIGDEYKSWKEGDHVIIATPTGSGKTTFVVSQLLKEALAHEKHVVYYCNRKVLRDQFEVQSKRLIDRVFGNDLELTQEAIDHLHILTYQGAELVGNYPNIHLKVGTLPAEDYIAPPTDDGMRVSVHIPERYDYKDVHAHEVMYYIFDEAHYFVSDALIRNETNFWCQQNFSHGISVFRTATPKPLLCFLTKSGDLPLSNEFYHIFNMLSTRKNLNKKYPDIHQSAMTVLDWWRKMDNLQLKLPNRSALRDAYLTRMEHPLDHYFTNLQRLYGNASERSYYYRTEPDYSYIDASYFHNDADLLEQIKLTAADKWIIFVDSEKHGEAILETLRLLSCGSAEFISKTRIESDPNVRFVYDMVVQTEKFPCRILISTSVMDCGCNIIDPEVKHMAIFCDNETTFLQMLGRKRVAEDERLRLYIALYPFRRINTRYNQCLDNLKFMMRMGLKNQTDYRDSNSLLSMDQLQDMIQDISSGKRKNLQYTIGKLGLEENGHLRPQPESTTTLGKFLYGMTYSKTAMLQMVTRLYDFHLAFNRYRKEIGLGTKLADFIYEFSNETAKYKYATDCVDQYTIYAYRLSPWNHYRLMWNEMKEFAQEDGTIHFDYSIERDDLFFLKHQLSWIGKEYDPSCWLLGSEKLLELTTFLDIAVESPHLRQDKKYNEQHEFGMQCIQLMLDLPRPPKSLKRNKSRYGTDRFPGKNVLNKWLVELNLPYVIKSEYEEYEGVDKRKTTWVVKYIDPNEDQNDVAIES